LAGSYEAAKIIYMFGMAGKFCGGGTPKLNTTFPIKYTQT
jgi:hypothetical protein